MDAPETHTMNNDRINRRRFVRSAAVGSAAISWAGIRRKTFASGVDRPALLGGHPIHSGDWPRWPQWRESWEGDILEILRSGRWYRGNSAGKIQEFETEYAKLLGAKRCLATASGTTALITSVHVMGVDAGDEVIVSPYTFIATYNAILMHKALPVFADTDPATLTIDPSSIESRITDRTRLIMPVHIYGMPCEMNAINSIADKHNLGVIEDACQAWLARYQGQACGTIGDLGCFSFQNSKHLTSGEGGAITGNSDDLLDRCTAFHNCGRATGSFQGDGHFSRGGNFRIQHFQAAMLLQQIKKLVVETKTRQDNADYLKTKLEQISGVTPARLPENSQAVWHLFPLRYDSQHFHGLTRSGFVKCLRAEGIPCGGGYHEQYKDGLLDEAIASRGFQRLFGKSRLNDYRDSFESLQGNRLTCATTVTLSQNLLLTDQKAMNQIAAAIEKIQDHSEALAASLR